MNVVRWVPTRQYAGKKDFRDLYSRRTRDDGKAIRILRMCCGASEEIRIRHYGPVDCSLFARNVLVPDPDTGCLLRKDALYKATVAVPREFPTVTRREAEMDLDIQDARTVV